MTCWRAHLGLGNVYMAEGQAEKAAEEYREALRLAPDRGASYRDLVNAVLALQRFDEAQQVIQQALRKSWIVSRSATLSTLWLSFGETFQQWRNSNSGLQANPPMRTLGFRSHPTLKHTPVTSAKRGN
ncbi:MAG TPA: tetratricopeptide repeat protein [Candidatus Acidoferrales bacterium]|nr:tetratricopeptide repeat protein [Candidatus Acidoferrales bacterium]